MTGLHWKRPRMLVQMNVHAVENGSQASSKLNRAYRAVHWALGQPGNQEKQVTIVPNWALYALIEAAQVEDVARLRRQQSKITLLVGVLLISVGIFGLTFIFGG